MSFKKIPREEEKVKDKKHILSRRQLKRLANGKGVIIENLKTILDEQGFLTIIREQLNLSYPQLKDFNFSCKYARNWKSENQGKKVVLTIS